MKLYALQEDFSAGELAPKAQGHVTTEVYKAGAKRMINCLPGRVGSVASRGGGRALLDALGIGEVGVGFDAQATTVDSRGYGVAHLTMADTPIGDFSIEVGPHYLRLVNKHKGVLHWARPWFDFVVPDGLLAGQADCAGHPPSDTVYLYNLAGNGQRSWLPDGQGAGIDPRAGEPDATDESFTVRGQTAGDPLVLRVTLASGAELDTNLTGGKFAVQFTPNFGGHGLELFTIRFIQAADTVGASSIWGCYLTKNGVQTISQNLGTLRPNEVRAVGWWPTETQFWVVLVGGGLDLPKLLKIAPYPFTLEELPCSGGPPAWLASVVSVIAYQGRLWLGLNDENGSLHASMVDYGPHNAGLLTGFDFRTADDVTQASIAVAGQTDFATTAKMRDSSQVSVTRNGNPYQYTSIQVNPDQDHQPGATVTLPAQAGGEEIAITVAPLPKAADALDLTLAGPAGQVVWFAVLHGLILGTTKMEKQFQQGATLAIDPAIGQTFDIIDHSALGSDERLPALAVNQKVLFFQRGRQMLRDMSVRYMWEQGLAQGGLVAEDVGQLGEHLLRARVRSFCYLKSPVPRIVFAFDDGTGGVATLGGKGGYAWSRLTVAAAYGGIYNVASANGADQSELWLGTGCGATLHFDSIESDIVSKTVQFAPAPPLAGALVTYDTETPLPPVMDGWVKSGVLQVGGNVGDAYCVGLPEVFLGQQVYVVVNGERFGPYAAGAGVGIAQGKTIVVIPAADAGMASVWVDVNGNRRITEAYVGAAYPEHRCTTLPLELANPGGTSQAQLSRKPQLYARLVDSYIPLINGNRPPERNPDDPTDLFAGRVTGDRRATELGFTRGAVVDIVMDYPLRFEISALFGGTQINHL